jgi:multiple antibiotic resistance protein
MRQEIGLFLGCFSTLLALINPLEALSVFLSLTEDVDARKRRSIANRSCVYALALMFFFLAFGELILRIFGVPLSMVRIAGGLVLMRIGYALFSQQPAGLTPAPDAAQGPANVAFVPLAMPIMFGPGGIATVIGMTSLVARSRSEVASFAAISAAFVATMAVTWLCLMRADRILRRLGREGVDAVTRIIGFFVSTMGVSLLFDGVFDALQTHGVTR